MILHFNVSKQLPPNGHSKSTDISADAFIIFTINIFSNSYRTIGCIKNTCEKKANRKTTLSKLYYFLFDFDLTFDFDFLSFDCNSSTVARTFRANFSLPAL